MLSPPQLAGMLNQELKVCVGCIDISTTMHRFIVVLGKAAVHVDGLLSHGAADMHLTGVVCGC